ncbi:sialidase-1-like [Anneissia japonica]|uniref:sialidase-1-like n=1 Tax=Anneissia japonica TaxID=1529436 RepID=UPI001425AF01|nr:sialidase-1-like [Anneissia japonica]
MDVVKRKPYFKIMFFILIVLNLYVEVNTLSYSSTQVKPMVTLEEKIWIAGDGDVSHYRIPLLTYTPQKNLLAMAEARKYDTSDAGSKFLAIRRSNDKGYSWKPQQFIENDGSIFDGISLGSVVVDDELGNIFIVFSRCNHYEKCNISSLYYVKSEDDGYTWNKPVNMSVQIGTKAFAAGPGYGIQLKNSKYKGRLLVCGHGTLEGDGMFCLISDDHGNKWRYGGMLKSIPYNKPKVSGDFIPDECQPLEMPDGTVIVNIRNQGKYHCHCRIIAKSADGGDTFLLDDVYFDENLIDPTVAAGALIQNGVMFFSNPMSTTHRVNMTLHWSHDFGKTWNYTLNIWPNPSGYSTMTAIPGLEDSVYILYEKGIVATYESLSFVKISLYP